MSTLDLKTYPDPCLRIKTKPVEAFTEELNETLCSMAEMMYTSQGVGLAATQVGLGLSILVIDTGEGLINFINPEILERSKEKSKMEEGCLSLPGITVNVLRPKKIKLRAQDEEGEFFIKTYDGLLAKAVQHEMDHLSGKLIIDYLDSIRRFFVFRKLVNTKQREVPKTCEVVCHAGKRRNRAD